MKHVLLALPLVLWKRRHLSLPVLSWNIWSVVASACKCKGTRKPFAHKLHSLLSRVGWELVLLKDQHDGHDGHIKEVKCTIFHACTRSFRAGTTMGLCGSLWWVARFYHFPNDWSSNYPILGWIHLPHPTCLSLPWPSLGESFQRNLHATSAMRLDPSDLRVKQPRNYEIPRNPQSTSKALCSEASEISNQAMQRDNCCWKLGLPAKASAQRVEVVSFSVADLVVF